MIHLNEAARAPTADPQEIHGIVADTHHQIENRQQKEEEDNA